MWSQIFDRDASFVIRILQQYFCKKVQKINLFKMFGFWQIPKPKLAMLAKICDHIKIVGFFLCFILSFGYKTLRGLNTCFNYA